MKALIAGGMLLGAIALAGQAQAGELDLSACSIPTAPTVPDGSTASEQEVVAAIAAFKTFQADNQATRDCLDQAKAAAGELSAEQDASYTDAYNGTVDAEQAAGDSLNAVIRAYKANNPG